MLRRIGNVVAALSAALFAVLVIIWIVKPGIEFSAGAHKRFFLTMNYLDATPEMMIALGGFFVVDFPIIVPMALLLVMCGLWLLFRVLGRRRQSMAAGFPMRGEPQAARAGLAGLGNADPEDGVHHAAPSGTACEPYRLDYPPHPRPRRLWRWVAGLALVVLIGSAVTYVLAGAYSRHKGRELNLQSSILNAVPENPRLVHQWKPNAAAGERPVQNWMGGPSVYDQLDAKADLYPIWSAGMTEGSNRLAVLVWVDVERPDGFDVEYAIIQPGNRFFDARLVNSGTFAFRGEVSEQPIRVWSGVFPKGDPSRFVFDFEIGGLRRSAEAKLAGSDLTFTTTDTPDTR